MHGVSENSVDPAQAEEFLRAYHAETPGAGPVEARVAEVRDSIERTGTYRHTPEELAYGARVAWRNSERCIGRLYWNSLRVRDRRHVASGRGMARELLAHLTETTNDGRIRPTITIFAPAGPYGHPPRIVNEQLIRYAGHAQGGGRVVGDPRNAGLTDLAGRLGWHGGAGTPFDVLPVIVQGAGEAPMLVDLPPEIVLEVPITHPHLPWFGDLGLRWHAVPAISNMCLEIGGIGYPAAPFNGWYMGTEIGARNLADTDRYDLLPVVAERLGLPMNGEHHLWRDRALVELNIAVLHSFQGAGVKISDHHTESRRFLTHIEREERAGRTVPADWSWIVPPMSGSTTPVFHRYYDTEPRRPAFVQAGGCPHAATPPSPAVRAETPSNSAGPEL